MPQERACLPPLTGRFADESDQTAFRFTFYCACCGVGCQSPPIPFSGAARAAAAQTFTPAQKLIWQAERDDAYERANRQAMRRLTRCAGCGRWVCEDCLDECADLPLCANCRGKRPHTKYEEGPK